MNDPLPPISSLPGKADFERDLGVAVWRGQPFALLLADVDDLKIINDLYGHPVGDDAIAALADSLRRETGAGVYAFGGDELALIVAGSAADRVGAQLAVLSRHWREVPLLSRPLLHVTASVGVCFFPREGQDARGLYAGADERMYAAKRAGGGQVVSADSVSGAPDAPGSRRKERLLERQGLLAALKGVLESGGRAEVVGVPGSGRSAFAGQVERVARLAGLNVLRIEHGPAQRLREEGWRFASWLDGQPLPSLAQAMPTRIPGRSRPLAVILDLNAEPDAAFMADLAPVFEGAHLLLSVGERLPGLLPADTPPLALEALSPEGVAALLRQRLGLALPEDLLAWATEATRGLPVRVERLARLLPQEAGRRRVGLRSLLETAAQDWRPNVSEQLRSPSRLVLPPLERLWGRSDELGRALSTFAGQHPGSAAPGGLLCLHGPSGRGKSRLAAQIALELQPHCSGGVLWQDARTYRSTEALLAGIAAGLGGQADDLPSLLRLLTDVNLLLVLDDARDDGGLAAFLERLCVAAPGLRVLVTAHRPLGSRGEQTLLLGPLPYEGAGSASARLAQAAAPGLHPGEAERLALFSGGETLDLLLLAKAAALRGAAQVMRELETGASVAAERRRPLSGVAYSWARFTASERRMTAVLSTYDGPFDMMAVQRVGGASDLVAGALIQQGHLHPQGGGHYRLPDLIAAYGSQEFAVRPALRQQARRALFADVQRRMAGHSLLTLEGRALFDLHRTTTESALRTLAQGQIWPQLAVFLAEACESWAEQGRALEARDLLQLALAGRLSGGGLRLRTAFARVLQQLGEHARAETLLRTALRQARRGTGRPVSGADQVQAQLTLGRIQHRRSAYVGATRTFSRLLGRPELSPESRILALHQRGRALLYLGRLTEADSDASLALEQARQTGHALAETLNTLALIRVQQDRHGEARSLFEEATERHQRRGEPAGVSLNLTGLAWSMLVSGDAAGAVRAGERLLRVYQDSNSGWETANTLTNLGHARARLGQMQAARADFWAALSLTVQIDAPSLQAEVLGGVADLLQREGQTGQAARLYAAARVHPGSNAEFRQFFAHLEPLISGPHPEQLQAVTVAARLPELLTELLEVLAPAGL